MFEIVLKNIIQILQPFHDYTLSYKQSSDTVLINSNFNCGFFINREILYDILRNKYTIQAIYDPCSYPGIQCKFYYNDDVGVQTGVQITTENKHKYKNITEVSFMIFRTGSVLIVGMCDENVLQDIYTFLKALLKAEFKNICQKIITDEDKMNKDKKKKLRKKTITIITGMPEETIDTSEDEDELDKESVSVENVDVLNLSSTSSSSSSSEEIVVKPPTVCHTVLKSNRDNNKNNKNNKNKNKKNENIELVEETSGQVEEIN
jgi:hypothetical protein